MYDIYIKKIGPAEFERLQNISKQTFTETFAGDNSSEDMTEYLSRAFSTDKLRIEADNPGSEFYFGLIDNIVVGYLKINTGEAQTEQLDTNALEVERIYVLKEFQGKRTGQILLDKAIQIARQKKVTCIWLGVWEKNEKAIKFYRKNGFIEFDKHIFVLGSDRQTDILMKLELNQ